MKSACCAASKAISFANAVVRVNNCQVGFLRGNLQHLRQADRLARHDSRVIRLPGVFPEGSRGLWIEVKHRHPLAVPFSGNSKGHGKRCLRTAPFWLMIDNTFIQPHPYPFMGAASYASMVLSVNNRMDTQQDETIRL